MKKKRKNEKERIARNHLGRGKYNNFHHNLLLYKDRIISIKVPLTLVLFFNQEQ